MSPSINLAKAHQSKEGAKVIVKTQQSEQIRLSVHAYLHETPEAIGC